jgi:superoxide dismutase, Fe-Mn family
MFEMPTLEYAEDALEPHINAEVIKHHYHKHTKKYFDTSNELVKGTVFEGDDLQAVINKDTMIRMDTKLFNNVSQAFNHAFYWKCLTPASSSGNPSDTLKLAIEEHFGSFDEFVKKFTDKATKFFGSGWCWLVLKDGRLTIKTTPNAVSPLTEKGAKPLLTCDLWEHAYLYQPEYFANRAAYVKAWWNVVNWSFVSENFENASSEK